MKDSIVVKTVLVGPVQSGKTAFVSKLQKKEITEKYSTTIGIDICVVEDARFRYQLLELSGTPQYSYAAPSYLSNMDLLLFFINPLSEEFALESGDFFRNLESRYTMESLRGIIIVFSHAEKWQQNQKALLNTQGFTTYLSTATTKPYSILPFSTKNSNPDAMLAALQKMVYDEEYDRQFANQLLAKLEKYREESSRRLMKPHFSRQLTLQNLQSALVKEVSLMDIRKVMIEAVRDIRESKSDGKLKYGIHFFNYHYGDFHNSKLYQLLRADLERLEPRIKLDELTEPEPANGIYQLLQRLL